MTKTQEKNLLDPRDADIRFIPKFLGGQIRITISVSKKIVEWHEEGHFQKKVKEYVSKNPGMKVAFSNGRTAIVQFSSRDNSEEDANICQGLMGFVISCCFSGFLQFAKGTVAFRDRVYGRDTNGQLTPLDEQSPELMNA